MEYKIVEQKFHQYSDRCKEIIKNTFFKEEDLEGIEFHNNIDLNNIIKQHRIHMIDIKLEHTMRMIEQIININEVLGLKFDFQLVMKVAVLYHDIGRFKQATWSNTYKDIIYQEKNKPFINHGDEGRHIFLNNNFEIDKQYIPIIGESIMHHVDIHKTSKLQYRFDSDITKININNIATGKINLNEAELQVASLITQLVADIDKTDILYQHLTDDFEMIKDYVYDHSIDSLDNIAKKWGIDKKEIIEYNQIQEDTHNNTPIKIPVKNIEIAKLAVPQYMKEMFFNNNWIELKELQKDPNWNFISILWWRLSQFLNNINFYSVLVTIEETKLLEQIENKIPKKYKPLVEEAFIYAKEVLVHQTIQKNQNNIYIKKRN